MNTAETIAALSTWIDDAPANAARDREAATWGRLAKVAEEIGEAAEAGVPSAVIASLTIAHGAVIASFIGTTGQNPRKGVTHSLDDVRHALLDLSDKALTAFGAVMYDVDPAAGRELLDVALTALCAVEHLDANAGRCVDALLWSGAGRPATAGTVAPLVALADHVTAVAVRAGLVTA